MSFLENIENSGIVGHWEMKYSFCLDIGGGSVVNAVERYVFTSNGICEHTYEDDSGLPNNRPGSKFSFKIDGNRIFFTDNGSYYIDDSLEFRIEGDRLILDYEVSEEIYTKCII